MKKNIFTVAVFFLTGWLLFGESSTLSLEVDRVIEQFSISYAENYPDLRVKRGVLILEPEEKSDEARKKNLGALIQTYLQEKIPQSLIFFQVDRDNLDQITEEYKLALSGMLNESTLPEIGEASAAAAIIHGSILIEANQYRVTLQLTDLSTGEILSTQSFTLAIKDMEGAAEQLQYEYVAKNGIGLSSGGLVYITAPTNFTKNTLSVVDITAKYRISRNFMIGGGIWMIPQGTDDFYRVEGDTTYGDIQPDLTGSRADLEIGQITNKWSEGNYLIHIDGQYTLNFSPKFNLGIKLSYLVAPGLKTEYKISSTAGPFYQNVTYDDSGNPDPAATTTSVDNRAVTLLFETMNGGRLELAPEFFITPRFAINGTLGYVITNKAKPRSAFASYGEWGFYEMAIESGFNGGSDETYYGFDPSLKPDGSQWTMDFSGLYAGIYLSFFF